MKRILSILLAALILAVGTAAYAEGPDVVYECGEIVVLGQNAKIDLDDDGAPEEIVYEILKDEEGYDTGYRLQVGDQEVTGIGWYMDENIRALHLDKRTGILLMVSDYGPSDDYETHFYLYFDGHLLNAGSIPSLPDSMSVRNGVITTQIRGNILYTWFREADYVPAYGWGENWETTDAAFVEVPRYLYPMGLIVGLKVDLPLKGNMKSEDAGPVLEAGTRAVLIATDDKEWVLIRSLDGSEEGWMQIDKENSLTCYVGEEKLDSYEVFDGLLFAD